MPRRIISLDADDTMRALERVPLLEGCRITDLRTLAEHAHMLAFSDGEVIVPEGEEGLGFYVVLSGAARVVQKGDVVSRLGPGDFFGEIALIERSPRTATVFAEGRTTCLGILRSHFRPLLVANPRIALRILEAEQARLTPASGQDA